MINVTRVLVKRIFCGDSDSEDSGAYVLKLGVRWFLASGKRGSRLSWKIPQGVLFRTTPSSLGSFGGMDSGPCQNHTSLVILWVISFVLKPSPRVVVKGINWDSVCERIFSFWNSLGDIRGLSVMSEAPGNISWFCHFLLCDILQDI